MNHRRSIAASLLLLLALLGTHLLAASDAQQAHSPAYDSAAAKIAWIGENAHSANPSTRPTTLTAAEWNAYLNEGGVKLPAGLSNIRISSQPEIVHGDAEVDFDRLTSNRTRSNPFLVLFTGKHHVAVTARFTVSDAVVNAAANAAATVRVDSVQFDSVEVPRIALEYFANRYLQPKFGKAVGMDATFPLRAHIATVTVGTDQVTITQR
jgi:hypothetical protein